MVDEAAREAIVCRLDQNLVVGAGAGSGKTSVLVDRVVALLESGVEPEKIAVITFTEAAASEARRRVFDRVFARLSGASVTGYLPEPSEASRSHLKRAADRLGSLPVRTLHGFALDLLEAEALEAGWLPGATLEDAEVGRDLVPAARRMWWPQLDRADPELSLLVRGLVSGADIDQAARRLLQFRDLSAVGGCPEAGPPWESVASALSRADEAANVCVNPDCRLLGALLPFFEQCRRALEDKDGLALLELDPPKTGNLGQARDWGRDGKKRFIGCAAELKALIAAERARLHRELLVRLSAELLPRIEAAKREQGAFAYDDLLFLAVRLLEEKSAARARLRRRYGRLLVDEVQDTDPLQARIVSLLTRAVDDPSGPWTKHDIEPGRLFVVGDPKQSIYRFRRADPRSFGEIAQVVGKGNEAVELVRNFRSVPGILDFVNHTFGGMEGYVPLVATRAPADLPAVVGLSTDGAEGVDEAEAVTRHLLSLARSGQVWDTRAGKLRRFEFGDAMVLLPAWTHAETLHDRMSSAGIPSFVAGGRAFFLRDEVRLALAGLNALENPLHTEAVVFVLRGLFGCTAEDLARHKAAGGTWWSAGSRPGPVAEALRVLAAVRRIGGGLVVRLDALLERSGAPLVWAIGKRPVGVAANLDKVRELIRRFETEGAGPKEVLERLDELNRSSPEEDLPLRPFSASAVEITTLFQAKGREKPVVVLAFMSRAKRVDDGFVDRADNRLTVKVGCLAPLDYDERRKREEEEIDAERQRWMYVAATRAKDQLAFILPGEQARKESLVARYFGPGAELRARVLSVPVEGLPSAPAEEGAFSTLGPLVDEAICAAKSADRPDPSISARAAAVADAQGRCMGFKSVRDVAKQRLEARRGALRFEKTGAGPAVGKAVHRVMEALDLSLPRASVEDDALELLPRFSVLERLTPEEMRTAEAILIGLLGQGILDEIRDATECWQEVPFAHPRVGRTGSFVTGVIDLCFSVDEQQRRWVVVDWKTDRPAKGSAGEASYREQVRLYAQALIRLRVHRDPSEVRTVLVGPVAAEPSDGPWLDRVPASLQASLLDFVSAGGPAPEVDGGPDAPVLLVWQEARVAVSVGADAAASALAEAGYRVESLTEEASVLPDFWAEIGLEQSASPGRA